MTTYPPGLSDHLKSGVTALCYCWKLTKSDGTVQGFTDHDRIIEFGGTKYEPQSGFTASEAKQSLGLATDTVDIEGALSSAKITEADIDAGKYDGARVETWIVNWSSPDDAALLSVATVGRIVREDGLFRAELRNLGSGFDKPTGRYFRKECDAELGDARCGVDLDQPQFKANGAVDELLGPNSFAVTGLDGFDEGWFEHGRITWLSGANSGESSRVLEHRALSGTTRIAIELPPPNDIAETDTFEIVAGCDKSFATCKAKFANSINFRGFPHMPGNDAAYSYASSDQVFDGSPIVP